MLQLTTKILRTFRHQTGKYRGYESATQMKMSNYYKLNGIRAESKLFTAEFKINKFLNNLISLYLLRIFKCY